MALAGLSYLLIYLSVPQGGGLLRVYSCSDVVANRCRIKGLQVEESS